MRFILSTIYNIVAIMVSALVGYLIFKGTEWFYSLYWSEMGNYSALLFLLLTSSAVSLKIFLVVNLWPSFKNININHVVSDNAAISVRQQFIGVGVVIIFYTCIWTLLADGVTLLFIFAKIYNGIVYG